VSFFFDCVVGRLGVVLFSFPWVFVGLLVGGLFGLVLGVFGLWFFELVGGCLLLGCVLFWFGIGCFEFGFCV